GGDLLRDAGARDRLRLLASGPRLGHGRHDHREPDAEREDGAAGDCGGSRSRSGGAQLPVQGRARHRDCDAARRCPGADETGSRAAHRKVHEMKIVVTGSIAFDYLMSFPGRFTEHILPEHLSRISLSFLVDSMEKRRGGCGPNIAYTLA